jgi:hypothetical protein
MAVNLSPVGGVAAQFFDNSGQVLTGGKIFTYLAGTTTPAVTYTTSAGNVPWSNPIILDAAGRVSGSGEIWLTDGILYKFILQDSNDVLIATYDNINGINSNFVAFTNRQEIQTATAGQTVFNLTTMQYQPATNSLTVFVDGVNQYGPGAQYAYIETDADTVTFINGLHVGALVKFTTSQLNSSGGVDASQVSYDPPFIGGVITNVEAKLAQYVSVIDFGAVGDGTTDDTAAIQAAIDASDLPFGKTIYFPPGQYKLTAALQIVKKVQLVAEPGSVQLTQHTANTSHIELGDGTLATRTNTLETVIKGLTFGAASTLSANSTGACLKCSYVALLGVYECRFFGANSGGQVLWNGIELDRVEDSRFLNIRSGEFVNNAVKTYGQAGLATRTVDVIFDTIRTTNCLGNHIELGPHTGGIFINDWVGLPVAANTSGLYIDADPVTEQGTNYFIVNPNIEGGNNANSHGIYVNKGQAVDILGGWVGGFSPNTCSTVWFRSGSNSCSVKNTRLDGPNLRIDGPACSATDVEISGDITTTDTGILIGATANGTLIAGGRVRQFASSGISITGTPSDVLIEGVIFSNIAAANYITGETYIGGPVIKAIKTAVLRNVTAAATITLNYGLEIYQVTGGTTISNIDLLAPNTSVTIQAGSGGITFNNAGNIVLKGAASSSNIAAFSATMFVCDGANWFQV